MKRPITGYTQDEEGDWVALLSCFHPQHVRHDPPLVARPWVVDEEGRQAHLGLLLDCVRCERFELPAHFKAYRRTPVFTQDTVPAGLRKDHTTRAGTWGKIHVLQGQLRYRVDEWKVDTVVTQAAPGIVVPEVLHNVEPLSTMRFFVEFYGALVGK